MFLHLCDIHIRNEFANTNKQEMVNSTFADRTGPGINSENSPTCRIFMLYHICPHGRICGKTPAEDAGIKIQGHDKWLTRMQNAAGAA